jgi:tetratricopeptide (TPR) repeat protein
MSSDDWFRLKTWTDADRQAFFARFKRSRKKAQYLRIQALHLEEAGLSQEAIGLLEMLVSDWPERSQLAQAHYQRGRCLTAQRRHDDALQAYRDAFAAQRAFPGIKNFAHLDFGELALALRRRDLYDEVLARIEEFAGCERFPILEYRLFTTLALIHEARREIASAKEYARKALEAAAKTEAPFINHRKLGLVGEQSSDTEARLLRLAARTH